MTDQEDRIDAVVAELDRAPDAQLVSVSRSPAAQALFEGIVATGER